MKYLLIFIILGQVCSPKGTGYEAPPYFYMQCFDTKEEAEEAKDKEPAGQRSFIITSNKCGF